MWAYKNTIMISWPCVTNQSNQVWIQQFLIFSWDVISSFRFYFWEIIHLTFRSIYISFWVFWFSTSTNTKRNTNSKIIHINFYCNSRYLIFAMQYLAAQFNSFIKFYLQSYWPSQLPQNLVIGCIPSLKLYLPSFLCDLQYQLWKLSNIYHETRHYYYMIGQEVSFLYF